MVQNFNIALNKVDSGSSHFDAIATDESVTKSLWLRLNRLCLKRYFNFFVDFERKITLIMPHTYFFQKKYVRNFFCFLFVLKGQTVAVANYFFWRIVCLNIYF